MQRLITDQDQLVAFELPAHWVEAREGEGQTIYYEERPGSGALRLSVITARAPKGTAFFDATQALRSARAGVDGLYTTTSPRQAVLSYTATTQEEGVALRVEYWEVAQLVDPKTLRMAMFSYTFEAAWAERQETQAERELVAAAVRQLRFLEK